MMDLGSNACERPECVTAKKIVEAAVRHIQTHGHTSTVELEDLLIEAGLADPARAAWRKKRTS